MEQVKKSGFSLIGIKLDKKTTNEGGQSNIDCGNLWQKFEREQAFQRIPDKLSDEVYAVYFDYEGDHTKPFSYFIGCKVKADAQTPEGMHRLTIPAQAYQKVLAKGTMPDCIAEAWKQIWSSEINRAYNYDLEVYGERSSDWTNAEVDIFISTASQNAAQK